MRARRALTAPLLALLALAVPSTALLAAPATAGAATNRPAPVQAVHSVQATPRAGMFCRTADAGKVVRTDKGLLRCDTAPGDARYRWRTVVK